MKFYSLIGVLGIILCWQISVEISVLDTFFFPGPFEIITVFIKDIKNNLFEDMVITLLRTLQAFGLAVVIGFPLGLVFGKAEQLYRYSEPIIDFMRSMPATALFPVFMFIFGIGDSSKIAVAIFASVLMIFFNTAYGVIHSKKTRRLAAQLMGASQWMIFKKIIFWESLPQTFVGLRNGLSLALAIIVVTEMFIGTNQGIGRRIIDAQIVFNIPGMFAALLAAGLIGYMLNYVLIKIEQKTIHWTSRS